MERRNLVPLAVIAFVLVCGFSGYSYVVRRPAHSLVLLGQAFHKRDLDQADKYLDTKATAAQVIDALVDAAPTAGGSSTTEPVTAGEVLGTALLDAMKPALSRYLSRQISAAISSGGLAEMDSSAGEPSAPVAGRIAAARELSFSGFGTTDVEGDSATVDVRLRHASLDTTFTMSVSMRRAGDHWRVVGIKNLGNLFLGIDAVEATRLKAVNEDARRQMGQYVRLGQLVSDRGAEGGYSTLRLRVPARNESLGTIEGMWAQIALRKSAMYPDVAVLELERAIPRGGTGVLVGEDPLVGELNYQALLSRPHDFLPKLERLDWRVGNVSHTLRTFANWDEYRKSQRVAR